MNKFILAVCCLMFFTTTRSQTVPASIPYQAIARNSAGQVLANTPLTVQFRIYNTMAATSVTYQEEHTLSTNAMGYFNVRIGAGAVQSGAFSAIAWSTGDVGYETWLDTGSGLVQLGGRSAFLSVPYALFAGNAAANPTISINPPNAIASPSAGSYSITVPSPTLSLNNNQLSISNGNTITLSAGTTYTPGTGVSITSGSVITNTAPDQAVTMSPGRNTNVLGAYPNYTVESVPSLSLTGSQLSISNGNTVSLPVATTYTPGPGVSITSGSVITNAAPDQTVTISGAGVTGAYPAFSITATPATTVVAGNNVTVSQAGDIYTVNATPSLSITGSQLSISNGNTVSLPVATTYTPGPGVSITSGSVITNTAPDQTVTLSQGLNTSVTGAYPNYTVNATPSLSLTGTQLSISNGNTVTFPNPITYTAGAGVSITSGSVITNTAPNQTVAIAGPNVTGAYPSYSIAASPATTVAAGTNVTVSQAGNIYMVNSTPSLSLAGSQLSISNGNTVNLPVATTYTPGAGISITSGSVIANTAPNQTVTVTGPNVTGAYPSYSIAATPATTVAAGTNVTVNQSGSSYTVNATTPNIIGTGNAAVSGTYPNLLINVPGATLTYTSATNVLKLTDGASISTVTLSTPASATLTGTGLAAVTNAAPNYTVSVATPTMAFNNASGTYSYSQGAYSNTINLSPNTVFTAGTLTVGSNTTVIPGTGIWTRSASTVTLTNTGDNVGIGVPTAAEKLVVAGNVAIPPANQYKYLAPKTRYFSMGGPAFNTEGSYNRQTTNGGVYIPDGSAGTQGNLYTGVNLPDGAVVTGLDAYVLDNELIQDFAYIQLYRQDGAVGTSAGNSVIMAQTPGTTLISTSIVKLSTTSITSPVVDNSNYVYYVRVGTVQSTTNLVLYKVVVTYTILNVE